MVTVWQMAKTLSASPLVIEEVLVAMPHHHRKALAVEVERDLVHLLVLDDGRALVLQDRVVQRTLDARLKVSCSGR